MAHRGGHGARKDEEDEEQPDPPRNFTATQLRKFDGSDDEKGGARPLYLSVDGIVFDASEGRDVYGPGGPFCAFAGRECGVALARGGVADDDSLFDDPAARASLSPAERADLDGWIDRLKHARRYPVLGRLVPPDKIPPPDRAVSREDLSRHVGSGDAPDGYAFPPIYLGASGKVYDVSFGGVTFYGPGSGYARFAGKDASRALAKMSFDPKDTEEPDTSDLSETERKTLADWIKTFEERKMYPCVGRLED